MVSRNVLEVRLEKWRCVWRHEVYIQKANEFYFNFCHFSALVASFQGKNTNSNDDNHVSQEKIESLRHRINQEASEKIEPKPEHVGMGNFSCFSCSPPDCRNSTICYNAVRCQTSQTRDVYGYIEKQKGCIKTLDHVMFHCAIKSYNGEHIHKKHGRSAQYAFECCKGNMCNENQNFPVLPEPYTEGNIFI